jgi:nucleotide-binding universal stress UspA family protein
MAELSALIPLDGTNVSEQALLAMPLLRSIGVTKVKLISVGEIAWDDPGSEASQAFRESIEKNRSYLESYLRERAEKAAAFGLEVEHVTHIGRPAEAILEEAEVAGVDLLAIATHGRTGIERFRLGSIADRVVRGATCPTLVIGPNVEVKIDPYEVRRIFVPLDGSDLSEEALPVARLIAEQTGASIDLMRVVSVPAMSVEPAGGYSLDMLQAVQEAAAMYLERVASEMKTSQTVRTTTTAGSVSEDLLSYLEANPADLVVMTSHARGGFTRWLLGSVADRMLHGPSPVLILRPGISSRLLENARAER